MSDDAAAPDVPPETAAALDAALAELPPGFRAVALTGAGISAASGIPTFRGPEGFWQVGSRVYEPQEMATAAMFRRDPESVWQWYLYRLGICRAAEPNAAHHALVDLDAALGRRFRLITQNSDGLHLRAGSPPERTDRVHGDLELVRCARPCTPEMWPVPEDVEPLARDEPLTAAHRRALTCPGCGGWLRPHVLWFDETYDEERFRFETALEAAAWTDVLVPVGTTGATALPTFAVRAAVESDALLIDVNPEGNDFGELAEGLDRGVAVRRPAEEGVPAIARRLAALA